MLYRNISRTLFNSAIRRCPTSAKLSDALRQRIQGLVESDKVVVFMKGNQQAPMCGFSNKVKLILDYHDVPFRDYDVLDDEDLREGIKVFSDWPTIPQVYVNRKFVGGCDILLKMHTDGELTALFDEEYIKSKFSSKL